MRVRRLPEELFSAGYRFFLPYLALYLIAWAVDLSTAHLLRAFIVLHVVNLALLLVFVWRRRSRFRVGELLFWSALLLLFLIPGAYLEFPSDTWEHLRRIYLWKNVEVVDDHFTTWKFAYFWGYSLLCWFGPLERRLALDVYSAFWMMLTAFQLHELARRLGFDATWSKIQVVAYFLFIGIGPLGFRHYGLSSTPLAYAAFLRALICCIDFIDGREPRALRDLPFLLVVALVNHLQEVIFIALGSSTLFGLAWYERLVPARKPRVLRAGAALVLLCLAAGVLVMRFAPQLYHPVFEPQLTWFGGFRLWQRWYFINAWGVHGALAMFLALPLLGKQLRLAVLTVMPAAVLLLPPSAAFLSWLFGEHGGLAVSHRILFAFPWSFVLVQGARELVAGTLLRPAAPASGALGTLGAVLILLALAAPPVYPWQGRLYYLVHRPHPDRTLRFVDETADWFLRNRTLRADCWILSDAATQFALFTQLGWPAGVLYMDRTRPTRYASRIRSRDQLLRLLEDQPICAVLVGIKHELPPPRPSPIAEYSRHWDHRFAVPALLTGDGFRRAAEGLTELGWTRTRVPPFYLLYEPPAASGPAASPAVRSAG